MKDDEKRDTIDLIIIALKDLEKMLDKLYVRMERIVEKLES